MALREGFGARTMFRSLIGLALLSTLLAAQRVEIYEDWHADAVGEASFEKPAEGISFYYIIRQSLEKKGYSVRHWDREAHKPFLLKWKSVQSWTDFKHRLGIGLPRKQVLEGETAYLIFSNLGVHLRELDLGRIPKEKMILFAWEPPSVQPEIWDPKIQKHFHKIYTWNDDLVDGIRFFKFYLPMFHPRIAEPIPYENRKFLTFIASRLSSKHPNELYSQREKIIRFFEERPEVPFDLYGKFWAKKKFRVWKGVIPDKIAVLKQYRFAIAYENSRETGYITEKLWDCFAAAVVPIYWGAPNIESYIPSDCYIDRRKFKNDEALLAYLEAMTKEEWETYIEKAGAFLKSEATQKFTLEHYARTLADAVAPLPH